MLSTVLGIIALAAVAWMIWDDGRGSRPAKNWRCKGGCKPEDLITIWSDGRSRKARCRVCYWVHHVHGIKREH